MHTLKICRTLWLAVTFCAIGILLGCGRIDNAPVSQGNENVAASPGGQPAEASLAVQTEQKLDPLTKEDVELYLKVMHQAADRVKSPLPADRAALEGAKKILAGRTSGRVPTPDDVKTLERATLVALSMDQIVAEEMKLDGRMYRGIAEAVESVVTSPAPATSPGKAATPVPDNAPGPLAQRLSSVNATNKKFLSPYREEIQNLIAVVHNPANIPK